jgi:hypothetical protein
MSEIRKKFLEFLGDRGAILLQWLEDAFAKVTNLQFHELTADEIAFFAACGVVVALAVLKLAGKQKTVPKPSGD